MILPATDVARSTAQWRLAIAGRGIGTFTVKGDRFEADALGRALLDVGEVVSLAEVIAQLHDDDREGFARGVHGVLLRDVVWTADVRRAAVAPERWLAVSASGVEGVVVGVIEDVSDARRTAQALARAERARDLIAGSIAHDLRAPVFNIILAAELLSKNEAGDAAAIRGVLAGARRVNMKVEELVHFARLSIGDRLQLSPARLDLEALAARCVELAGPTEATTLRQTPSFVRPSADTRPAVVLTARGDTTGTWDAAMVGAAVLTLIDNALRHGAPPLANVEVDGTASDEVIVRVRNEGTIQPELLALMFELVRAPRSEVASSGGLGLGLFNARQIALAHGGDVTVSSQVSTGTLFSLRLPRHASFPPRDDAERRPPRASPQPSQQPLQERAPREYWPLLDRYERLLEVSLHRRLFKKAGETLPDEVARLAEELGALHASARDVAELHARALRRASLLASATKAKALVIEGRLLSLELMGRLLSYYRKRAGPRAPKGDLP